MSVKPFKISVANLFTYGIEYFDDPKNPMGTSLQKTVNYPLTELGTKKSLSHIHGKIKVQIGREIIIGGEDVCISEVIDMIGECLFSFDNGKELHEWYDVEEPEGVLYYFKKKDDKTVILGIKETTKAKLVAWRYLTFLLSEMRTEYEKFKITVLNEVKQQNPQSLKEYEQSFIFSK